MGRSNNRLILIIGAFVVFGLLGVISGFKGSFGSGLILGKKGASTRMHSLPKSGNTVFTSWNDTNSGHTNSYDNDYEAATNYANSDEEAYAPLVASTTYINKKKNKKAKNKTVTKKAVEALEKAKKLAEQKSKIPAPEDERTSSGRYAGAPNTANNVAGAQAQDKKNQDEEDMNSFEYWETPIFENQDPAAVSKLIQSYQVQKVSSGTFYGVVEAMTQDERPLLREYAVTSLKATPSTKSFSYLTGMKHNDMDADIRLSADREVASYASASRLNYVITSLHPSGESQQVTLEAIRVVDTAAKNYGSSLNPSEDSSTPRDTASTGDMEPKLAKAYDALGILAQTTNDATIKTQAEQTMENISKVMTI